MRYSILFLTLFLLNCTEKKSVQLPEIQNASITEVLDVSPAYIFYNETQPDSTEFNRKNLIGTTNWLVNVDKRLTLKQVVPHLQYLQNKRNKASMHKNENAKNYFTCNDTGIGNLGFVEFTNVNYKPENPDFILALKNSPSERLMVKCFADGKHIIYSITDDIKITIEENETMLTAKSFSAVLDASEYKNVVVLFQKHMAFQDYIAIKSRLNSVTDKDIHISENEYLFD